MSRSTTPEPTPPNVEEEDQEIPVPEWLKTASEALEKENEIEPAVEPAVEPVAPEDVPEPENVPEPDVPEENSSHDLEENMPPYSLIDLTSKVNDILARLVQLECNEAVVTQPAVELAAVIESEKPEEIRSKNIETRIIQAPRRGRSYVPSSRNIFLPFYGFRR